MDAEDVCVLEGAGQVKVPVPMTNGPVRFQLCNGVFIGIVGDAVDAMNLIEESEHPAGPISKVRDVAELD